MTVFAAAAAATEDPGVAVVAGVTGVAGPLGGELEVSVRLIDEGALVRWRRADADRSRCSVRWYRGAAPGEHLLATYHTHHDYLLGEETVNTCTYY